MRAGVEFKQINFLTPPDADSSSGPLALMIGEGAIDQTTQADLDKLAAFVQAGGRVLILAQQSVLGGLPVTTGLEPREWSSMPFVRTPQHPILQGVSSWDLHFWSPDRVSARGAYSKPTGGPCITLIDSGCDKGLEWTQMFEAFRGKGNYLVCQLPLVGSYDQEPMARELLARVVRYVAGQQCFCRPTQTLELVAQKNSPLPDKLHDLGVAVKQVKSDSPLATGAVRMIDGPSLAAMADKLASLKQAISDGAVVVVHDISPAQKPLVSELAGQDVQVTVMPLLNWDGRGYRNGFAALTAGTSHLDFYWKRYEGGEIGWNQGDDPSYKIEDLVNYSVWCPGALPGAATELVYPGAMGDSRGQGQARHRPAPVGSAERVLATQQARVVTAMMLGLGVAVEPVAVQRPCPLPSPTSRWTCTGCSIAASRMTSPTTARAAGPTRVRMWTCARSRPGDKISAACLLRSAKSPTAASC